MDLNDVLGKGFDVTPLPLSLRAIDGEDIVHVYDNPAAAELMRRSRAELEGRRATELGIEAQTLPLVLSKMRLALERRTTVRAELTYALPSGRRTFRKSFTPMHGVTDDDGRTLFVCLIEDITELHELRAGVERADRLSTLGTLTAALGHEVATPLLVVSTNLTLAQEIVDRMPAGQIDPRLCTHLADAVQACDHLTHVLTVLRDYGKGRQQDAKVRCSEAVHRATRLAMATLRHQVDVVVTMEADPVVVGGVVQLTQIILNLVMNGARAALGRHGEHGARVEIRTRIDGSSAVIEVIDNGPGIPDDVREHLFEPFVSAHGDTGGTGLGLFVARGLAESCGARLSISSTSEGTTGRIVLQLAR
jgi:signal transduction histidine kinase